MRPRGEFRCHQEANSSSLLGGTGKISPPLLRQELRRTRRRDQAWTRAIFWEFLLDQERIRPSRHPVCQCRDREIQSYRGDPGKGFRWRLAYQRHCGFPDRPGCFGAGASIILNGSMAATIGSGESSAYAASKAGVRAMTASLPRRGNTLAISTAWTKQQWTRASVKIPRKMPKSAYFPSPSMP